MLETAEAVNAAGATMLRGGAFKPRTSPYSFQRPGGGGALDPGRGPRADRAGRRHRGAGPAARGGRVRGRRRDPDRRAQHAELRAAHRGRPRGQPVLLKRGPSATIEELLLAAEYIVREGNSQVILCERGIRTFEPSTRNTLDLGAIPVLKEETHLPVIVDPSTRQDGARWSRPLARGGGRGRGRADRRGASRPRHGALRRRAAASHGKVRRLR